MAAFGGLRKKVFGYKTTLPLALFFLAAVCGAAVLNSKKEGLAEYVGAQRDIFVSGKATKVVSLEDLAGQRGLYAVGPIEGLDGEITVFDSKPYITKVRGGSYTADHTFNHGAFFLVWSEWTKWQNVPIPAGEKGYVDLQKFVRSQAQAAGIDVAKPFPFLLSGTPVEIKWHINVDRTEGKPITKELFAKSKEHFVTKNEPVDIIGFYGPHHAGIFLPKYTPAIREGSGMENEIHIHLVSRTSKASGHIDELTLGEDMVLRLPKLHE
jgi:acetolactate decarboxylase